MYKALSRSSNEIFCMHVMLLVMLSILAAACFHHSQSNSSLPSFDQLRQVSCNASIYLTVKSPKRTFFRKASCVGGPLFIRQFICVNKYLRHLSTVLCRQVLSYLRTTKCSIISEFSVEISPDRDSLISVTSEKAYHAFHAVDLPLLRNCDTASHPVKVYQKITAPDTLSLNSIPDGGGGFLPYQFIPCNFYKRRI